jgi:hypothetical protein
MFTKIKCKTTLEQRPLVDNGKKSRIRGWSLYTELDVAYFNTFGSGG